jgi:U3 small nucleolar RNA-associated protein MPP10
MNEDQIWQQLDLRAAPLCSNLQLLEGETSDSVDSPGGMSESEEDEEDEELSDQSGDSEGIDDSDDSEEAAIGSEEVTDLHEEESEDEEDESDNPYLPNAVQAKRSSKRAAIKTSNSELDDNFFSLDAFNRETEEAEAAAVSRGRLGQDSDEDESDYEGDDIDLFKPVDDLEDLDEDASEDLAGMQFCILLLLLAQMKRRAVVQRFFRSSQRIQVESYRADSFLEVESAFQRPGQSEKHQA